MDSTRVEFLPFCEGLAGARGGKKREGGSKG
jgi:hypothetical protein